MQYEGSVFRPPSEARSLLVQVTIGCAWNKCTFCDMYADKKFRVRSMDEIMADLREGARHVNHFKRIFLCDGDALALSAAKLFEILEAIQKLYPGLESVRAYASARDVIAKTPEELKKMRTLGLDMVYIGLESGSDEVLASVNKGITRAEMIESARMLKAAGIEQSISIISGLGGEVGWRGHILETASALNEMQPEYVGMLVLTPGSDSRMHSETATACAQPPPAMQVLQEMKLLLENLEQQNCFFSSAHPSNYATIKGHLPEDKQKMIAFVEKLIEQESTGNLRRYYGL